MTRVGRGVSQLLAALLLMFVVARIISAVTGSHDPSVADLRNQGYASCHSWRNNLGSEPDAKCIYQGHLVEFQDSPYHVDLPSPYGD